MDKEAQDEKKNGSQAWETNLWRWALLIGALAVGVYAWHFGWRLGRGFSPSPDQWGTFGDYIGGVMNPLVALAALYWLTRSVSIQKQELAETRKELAETRRELAAQAENGRQALYLNALTALHNANLASVATIENRIKILEQGIRSAPVLPNKAEIAIHEGFIQQRAELLKDIKPIESENQQIIAGIKKYLDKL